VRYFTFSVQRPHAGPAQVAVLDGPALAGYRRAVVAGCRILLPVLFVLPAAPLCAAGGSYEQRLAVGALDGEDSFWTLVVENDLFGAGTDRNYTSGVRITYFDVGADLPAMARWLEDYAPVFEVNDTTSVSWSLFAGIEARAMARNLFLDGNTFRDSPSVNGKPLVLDVSVGGAVTLGRLQLSYTLNWRSREFSGQDKASGFGAISLGYRLQ